MVIYLDNASTTKVDKEVVKTMLPYFSDKYGNASSLHFLGEQAKEALESSREKIADLLKVDKDEIIFTSSGTESDNLAIKGIAFSKGKGHIITSKIEHPAVLETCKYLGKKGFKVSYLNVDKNGIIDLNQLKKEIRKDTILVTIMHANNEIGTIQPIEEISKICKDKNILFHSDMVQSLGKVQIDLKLLDLASFSGHKIYGPKGIGCLFVRKGVKLEPLIHGGGHEFNLRSSTENVGLVVGFAKAMELIFKDLDKEKHREEELRDYLIKEILKIPGTRLNGSKENRLPGNVNVSFEAIEGESLVLKLNFKNIAVSTGSACSSKKLEASHVLLAVGLKEKAHGSLRISLGKFNSKKDIDYLLKVLPGIVKELRSISPLK